MEKWICNGISLKTHKNREHRISSEKGSEDKETQVMEIECEKCNKKFESVEKLIEHVREIECVECNDKFVSVDKLMEHVNENECDQGGKWLCCRTYLRKHKKREHEITNEESSKEEENQKDSS